MDKVDSADPIGWVKESARPNDLLIFSGLDSVHEALAREPDLGARRFLVAISPVGGTPEPHPEATDAFVAGRSLAEGPAR
jgi:hypothetical protein